MGKSEPVSGLAAILLFLGPNAWATSAPLDLSAALERAQARSPSLTVARAQLEISRAQAATAARRWFPMLELSSSHGVQGDDPPSRTSPWASSATLGLSSTLYDGESQLRAEAAELDARAAEIRFARDRDRLALDLSQEWLDYGLKLRTLEIRREQARVLEEQRNQLASLYRHGLKLRQDYLRFEAQVSRTQLARRAAEADVERSRAALRRLLGEDASDPSLDFVPLPVDPALAHDLPRRPPPLATHPTQRLAELETASAEVTARIASRRRWADVTLAAGANYGSSDYLGRGGGWAAHDRASWQALLGVKLVLWDWGIRARDAQVAGFSRDVAATQARGRVLDVSVELTRLMLDLEQGAENLQLAQRLLDFERDGADLVRRDYREGRASYLDLVTAIRDRSDAEIQFQSALNTVARARLAWRFHEGTLYEHLASRAR